MSPQSNNPSYTLSTSSPLTIPKPSHKDTRKIMKSTVLEMPAAKEKETKHNTHLELRLGVSGLSPDTTDCSPRKLAVPFLVTTAAIPSAAGTKRRITETAIACGGFVHPWSLAARQQKAAFEQAHHISTPLPSSVPGFGAPSFPATVGWPPVRTFRRNIVGSQPTDREMEGEKEAKKSKVIKEEDTKSVPESRARAPTLYVKVNMEGFAVGRKIDLKAHDSYDSLSRTLQRMFNNFLSASNSNEEEQDDSQSINHILLYEDHEGDRMLVGDVPWEMFIATAKRLYITHNSKAHKTENKEEVNGTDDGIKQ